MGLTHFDEAPVHEWELGHLGGRWTLLGEGARSDRIGLRRIQLPAGRWSTPAHEHGRAEEIFFVRSGTGIAWQDGATAAIRAGDCIVFHPRTGPHTIHALEPLDVLAFGTRDYDESPGFPQLSLSLIAGRPVQSGDPEVGGVPFQFIREAEHGAPELSPEPGPRPATIVNLDDVEPETLARPRVQRTRRRLSARAGSRLSGLQHVETAPGKEATPQHCHSIEEEMFVILAGDGALLLGSEPTPVRAGHVISRPAATGVAHVLRAGRDGLTHLAYGTRDPGDVCYYPRSGKIAFRGVGVIARLEQLDYWDGEDGESPGGGDCLG